jgi:probable HAF family extracellular repeat protein
MTRSHILTIGALALVGLIAPLLFADGAVAATSPSLPTLGISYTATDLGPGAASDVNDFGQVVGTSGSHAVLWDRVAVRDLGTLPAPYDSFSTAVAINNRGQIIGNSDDSQGHTTHAFIWRNGVMTDLGTLGGPSTQAAAINDFGEVAGYSNTATIAYYHNGIPVYVSDAFLWRNGHMTDLGDLGGQGSEARDINEFGQVAGILDLAPPQAGIWKNGQWMVLGGLSAGDQTEAVAINDLGQVVGTDDTSYTPLLWTAGHATNLAVACPGFGSNVMDLNDFDWIVGANQDPGHVPAFGGPGWFDPIICSAGTATFLPPLPDSADNWPSRMNNLGAVAGYANFEGGAVHAVLWRPSLTN